MHAVAELFKGQHNMRGAGSCYMIIGTKLAMQSQENYWRAIEYMKCSENLQNQVIESN